MKLLVVFSILLSLLSLSCADSNFLDRSRKDQSILQGTDVDTNDPLAKSVVLITQDLVFEKDQPLFFGVCTGLIISKRVVLTAAHCVENGYKTMKIVLNPNPREDLHKEEVFNVLNAKTHPSYDMKNLIIGSSRHAENFEDTLDYYDIALLVMDRDFPSEKASPYALPSQIQNLFPAEALVAGFGKTTTLKNTEKLNYKAINGSLKQARIQLKEESFIKGRILLNQKSDSGVCKGDSGSPLFVSENGEQKLFALAIGVFSKMNANESDLNSALLDRECTSYGVFLVLDPVMEWIRLTALQMKNSANGHFHNSF